MIASAEQAALIAYLVLLLVSTTFDIICHLRDRCARAVGLRRRR